MTIQKALQAPYKNHTVGVVKRSMYKTQLLISQSTLKTTKRSHFTTHLKPSLRHFTASYVIEGIGIGNTVSTTLYVTSLQIHSSKRVHLQCDIELK